MSKKEHQRKPDEGGGILIPILVAAMVCVALTTTFIVGYGLQYTAEQRAIKVQQSESAAPARSLPTPSESPVQIVSAPLEPTGSEPQQPEDTAPEESAQEGESQPIALLPSASPPASAAQPVSPSPSSAPHASPSPTPSARLPESQAPSNTPQVPAGNDRDSKFASGQVLATTESDNNGKPVYHTKNCTAAKKIAEESELWYESEQAAKAASRDLCGICGR